jgi:LPS O-antigen subunit length determinant protein (WzzB/FepE family)
MASSNYQDSPSSRTFVPNTDNNYTSHDEISVLELWDGLLKHWKTIAVSTILGAVIAISGALVYNNSQDPTFNVTVYVLPPKDQDIQSLYFTTIMAEKPTETTPWTPSAPTIPRVTSAYIFDSLKRNLESVTLQNKFSQENNVPIIFNVGLGDSNLYINTESTNPDNAKKWITDYLEFVDQHTITEIASNLRHLIDVRINVIQHSLDFLRVVAKKQTEIEINQLKEALEIAERLNIAERIIQTPLPPNSVPLYYLGSKALRAELDTHLKKKSDKSSHSSNEIRLSQQLLQLREISFNFDQVRAAEIASQATVDQNPIRPSTTKILVIGFLISFLGGLFLAFFKYFIQRQRNNSVHTPAT